MKNGEGKRKNRIRKSIAAVGAFIGVIGIGAIIISQARRNVLESVDEYANKDEFRILEIVPTNENHANEEIGYFVSEENITEADRIDFMNVSKAKSLGGRSNTDPDSEQFREELQNFVDMRDYGLIKYEGIDRGTYNVDVSEYPVYSKHASFVKNGAQNYAPLGNQFVLGTYKVNNSASGAYFLQEDYVILEDGKIYKRTIKETVSDNTVSGNGTVSGNDANTGNDNEVEYDYTPVAVGDRDNKGLPEGIEQRFDDNGNQLYTGDADFEPNDSGVYYGLTEEAHYYYQIPSEENPFYNGDWFREYVLGDRTLQNRIVIDTIPANQIERATLSDNGGNAKYDLIYISGTYEAYINANVDLTEDVVMHLFNITTKDEYQAVIMDYALLGPTSSTNPTNIEKLALLLWQQDQRAIAAMNTEGMDPNAIFTFDADGNMTGLPVVNANVWAELGASMQSMPGMGTGNFVAGSVYVYQHMRSYFAGSKSQVDAKDFFANGDFATSYSDAVIATGFSYVRSAIQINNVNNSDKRVSEVINPAAVIQYILAYDGTMPTLIKSEYNVLEIQPVKAFLFNTYWGSTAYVDCKEDIQENRDEFIEKYFDDAFAETPGLVSFTSMTIEEFIGRNEDLNETYDMIYIGSNTTHTIPRRRQVGEEDTNGDGVNDRPIYAVFDEENNYYYTNPDGLTKVESPDQLGLFVEGTGPISDFNDNHMDGMIYYNIGDIYTIGTLEGNKIDSLLGTLIGEVYSSVEVADRAEGRFSGRDLTEDKKNQLIDYLNTGYPVVVAGDILRSVYDPVKDDYVKTINPTKYSNLLEYRNMHNVDHGRVDNASKLYEFLEYGVNGTLVRDEYGEEVFEGGNIPNLISEADVENELVTKAELAEFLNEAKLTLNITSMPVQYSYSTRDVATTYDPAVAVIDEQTKLTADPTTGKYYLDYEFTISNAATIIEGGDTYGVHLFIDVNADGKFSESEELADCTVTNAVTGAEIPFTTGVDGRIYSLNTDVLYKLRREVPEGFSGILPWCLEVIMDSNASIRASEIGYTQVPRQETEKINIKILQISKNNGESLNLQNQIANPTETTNNNSHYFGLYLYQLEDYKVDVTRVSQDQYEEAYRANNDYLEPYDMLILGFGDAYDAFDDDGVTVQGLIDFMETGKPVLLTHDLVMFRTGVSQTRLLRNIVGMDRYGVYSGLMVNGVEVLRMRGVHYKRGADDAIMDAIEAAGRRVAYTPGEGKESIEYHTHGFANMIMIRVRGHYNNANYARRFLNYERINDYGKGEWSDQHRYVVHNINEGQITTYPYILPDSFTVAETHNQWYQLDMESDMDQDGETDVVVWYTLGNKAGEDEAFVGQGSEYNQTPNDVINNYYIYNRGNITYSGVGHHPPAAIGDDKYEAQLFVNTMIAAYRAGVRAPSIRLFETPAEDSKQIDSLAVAYDKNVGKNAETGDAQSSVLRFENGNFMHEFVDEGDAATKVYFQINDPNFIRGDKKITAKFYLENPEGAEELTLSDGTAVRVSQIPMNVYTSDFTAQVDSTNLSSGARYGINLPLSYLATHGELNLYITAQTTIENVSVTNKVITNESPVATKAFSVVKMDLLNLD